MNRQKTETTQAPIIYSTVNQLCARHPAFTKGGIRALIFNEKTNGLRESGAVVRISRKVLINEEKFFSWIETQDSRSAV